MNSGDIRILGLSGLIEPLFANVGHIDGEKTFWQYHWPLLSTDRVARDPRGNSVRELCGKTFSRLVWVREYSQSSLKELSAGNGHLGEC